MGSIREAGANLVKTTVLIIFVAGAAALGWFVWQAKHNTVKTLDNASQAQVTETKNSENKEAAAPTTPDITADWTPYASDKGKFALRYPKAWVQPLNRDLCSPGLFDRSIYLGPDAESVLKCATEYFGQMGVSSVDGDKRADYNLGAGYKDITAKDVTVNGIAGQRISGVAAMPSADSVFAPVEGTIEVRYVFFGPNNFTYVARYTQAPKGHSPSANVLPDFDLMVTKTLKFNS